MGFFFAIGLLVGIYVAIKTIYALCVYTKLFVTSENIDTKKIKVIGGFGLADLDITSWLTTLFVSIAVYGLIAVCCVVLWPIVVLFSVNNFINTQRSNNLKSV